MPVYRIMTIDDYEAAYDLWIKCGNGLNDKDDSIGFWDLRKLGSERSEYYRWTTII